MKNYALAPITSRPDNLTSMVFEAVQASIISAAIPPGSRVSEAALASQLKVSKTPVREALLRLRHIGLVEPTAQGLKVILPSVARIRDAYELRAGLEGVAAFYAAQRASDDEREHISEEAKLSLSCAVASDAEGFRSHDQRFHLSIARATRNKSLQQSIEDALALTSALRERDVRPSHGSVVCATEHMTIAEAIRAGDAAASRSAITEHILHVMSLVLAEPATSDGSPVSPVHLVASSDAT